MSEWDLVSSPDTTNDWDSYSTVATPSFVNSSGRLEATVRPRTEQIQTGAAQAGISTVGSAARGIAQGFTLNTADELAAIAQSVGSKLGEALVPVEGVKNLPADFYYNNALAQQNELLRQDYNKNPVAALGGNLAGGLASGGLIKTGVTKAVPALGNYLGNAKTFLGARGRDALVGVAAGIPAGYFGADPTAGESRGDAAAVGGLIGGVTAPVLGSVIGSRMKGQTIEDLYPVNVPRDSAAIGEELGRGLLSAAGTARQAKNAAYEAATPAMKMSGVYKDFVPNLADDIRQSIKDFDPKDMKQTRLIHKYTDDLVNKKGAMTINDLEAYRRRLNNIKANVTIPQEDYVKNQAKKAFDSSLDKMFERGIVYGDESALKLIKEARAKNAYYSKKFSGEEANNVIKKYVDNSGGVEAIAPEKLIDMMTSLTQSGLNNTRAVKDILGEEAVPLLKAGYLNKLQANSVLPDDLGNSVVKPITLAKDIDNFLKNNPTLSKEIFTQEELLTLRQLSNSAKAAGKTPAATRAFIAKLRNKLPFLPDEKQIKLEDITTGSKQKTLYNRLPSNPSISIQPSAL